MCQQTTAPAPPDDIPEDIASVEDYEHHALQRMTPALQAYFNGAATDEVTLDSNRTAFRDIALKQRVLTRMRTRSTATRILGQDFAYPVMLAPVAYHRLVHPEGELATVRAASAMGANMVVSTQASTPLETMARASSLPNWFQLYIKPDRHFTLELVRRAEAAGYQALVVTVDMPINSLCNREQRAGFELPAGVEAANLRGMEQPLHTTRAGESPLFSGPLLTHAPTWHDVAWLQSRTQLPVLLKGITTAEDARLALARGIDGLIVSNHGGRSLDTMPAAIDLLPEVVAEVGNRMPVMMDGGIRRGSDIFKALALGAQAVLVGRPQIHALATAGTTGVAHMLHLLRTELEVGMALAGTPTLADITPDALYTQSTTTAR